jgi:molecular chaperone GrpE (heat shock protein)
MQKGYMIADRLLRPAMVTVAKQKENDEQSQT